VTGRFPGGRRFAFTIFDDTDVATVENVKPVYDLLATLGMRTTKTVWPFAWHGEHSHFSSSETLEDPHYLGFVKALAEQGFEIASHGATMETSDRETTLRAHERLKELFGTYPRAYANHAQNRENVYWGADRIDVPWLRSLYVRYHRISPDFYQGHVPGSPFWWGDACAERHHYVRNLTFNALNALEVNPSMPYHDPSRPLVRFWFSATDAEDCEEFVDRFSADGAARLERDGGVCIVATHLGKGFTRSGRVDARVERILRDLAGRAGWFVPVSDLLDWLLADRAPSSAARGRPLSTNEWRSLQHRWARDLILRKLNAFRRRIAVGQV
jgi:hypothetical protein